MIVNLSMSIHPWTVQNLGGYSQPPAYSSRHAVEPTLYPEDLAFHHGTFDTGHFHEYLLKRASIYSDPCRSILSLASDILEKNHTSPYFQSIGTQGLVDR
jgi:hypothetical protein